MRGNGARMVRAALIAALLGATSSVSISVALAQQQASPRVFSFDIPAKRVTQGVNDIGRITGLSVAFRENSPISATGKPVRGTLTAQQALSTLLEGTGLTYGFSNDNTVQIFDPSAPAADSPVTDAGGAVDLGVITVEGQSPATTEGTGSYTTSVTTVGGLPEELINVPRTITVTTSQQIEDQNLNTVNQVLANTNGVTIVMSDEANERSEIYARGFAVNSYQIDGMSISGNNDVNQFDTSIYDRVEVLKGPGGLLQGAREPGATVNLVHKLPTDTLQVKASAETGSWDKYRAELDVSTPLFASENVRGRFIGVFDSAQSYMDIVESERKLIYGVLEFDLTDSTVLTVGATLQETDGRGSRGLPAYADGTLLDVSRSTFAGPDWAYSTTRSAEVFGNIEHEFDNGAVFKASANYLDRSRDGLLAYAAAAVDPLTGMTELAPEHRIDAEDNINLDTSFVLPVELGGLTHTFMVGADYQKMKETRDEGSSDNLPFNIYFPNYNVPQPYMPINEWTGVETEQSGIYGQAQIKPTEWSTIILGGRVSWWSSTATDEGTGEITSDISGDGEFTPYVGGVINLTPTLSAYVSYAAIFMPQDELTADLSVLPPREGRQYEAGLKASLFDGRANASAAIFDIEETNRAIDDPDEDDYSIASGPIRSRGFEAEISGEVLPSWQVTAGYTYLDTQYVDDPNSPSAVVEFQAPRHSFKLWNKYTFTSGALEGVSIGGGITAVSDFYQLVDDVKYEQVGFAVFDAQIGYKVNENLRATFTVTNLLDKVYYQTVGSDERQNHYGAPRAFALKLNATF